MRNSTDRDVVERDLEVRRESQIARDNANAAGSFALGIALISLVGVVIAMFVFDRGDETTAPTQQQPPDVNITVPSPTAPQAPDINIQVPEGQAPVAPAPVEPAPVEPAPVAPDALPAQPPQ